MDQRDTSRGSRGSCRKRTAQPVRPLRRTRGAALVAVFLALLPLQQAASKTPVTTEMPVTAEPPVTTETPLANSGLSDAPHLDDESLLEDLSTRTFRFFWETANPANGLVPDRWPSQSFASIAAVGFGLTAYPVGVERGYITREQAVQRTLATLRFFATAPQGPEPSGNTGYKGFFYHFLDLKTGLRHGRSELSTVDTALLLGGVLFAQSYFTRDDPDEARIRKLAETIYARVDWRWAQAESNGISLAWRPESGFSAHDWSGYNEAMIVYLLALGAPEHALGLGAWRAWTDRYEDCWGSYYDQEFLMFGPSFGHQYTHIWVDFRGIQDDYMRRHGLNYFKNSRRAALAQYAYAEDNPLDWKGYGNGIWGLTASDGPVHAVLPYEGEERQFRSYSAHGIGYPDSHPELGNSRDGGTVAPTAAIGFIAFAPRLAIEAIREMRVRYGRYIYKRYGFLDAFNPSFTYDIELKQGRVIPGVGWVADDYLGIDQGPILLMVENYRSGLVWEVMRQNPHIRAGLERAGFTGGWLDGQLQADAGERPPAVHSSAAR